LYAVQVPRYHPKESNWQDYHHFTANQLPSTISAWLLDSGSLTQRLVKASNNQFQVRVISQKWQQAHFSERSLLGMAMRERAIIREVALLCNAEPWVFARSVIPASSLTGHLRQLRRLKDSSLGEMLFRDPAMHRHPFQIATIDGQSHQIPNFLRQASALWGRRSRFELSGKPLMVSEIFLPAFRP
jgi:chorismate--pyruvate lyase